MTHGTRCQRVVLALVSVALVYLSFAAAVTVAEDTLVPESYIITKSDPYNDNDTAPDANCMPHGRDTVSCPGRDGGRLFDMVDPSSNTNMKWKISHHWRASEKRDDVQVELVFSCPVTISAMTWDFFQDDNALPPTSANWSVTALAENGKNISQYIATGHRSTGMTTTFNMSSISGFPASRRWHIIIPMPPSQWLLLYELGVSGKTERIVPHSYSINESDPFRNKLPDKFGGCVTENHKTNCSTPGKLFDGMKPEAANASLFHWWQMQSNNKDHVQLMLMFQESVIIRKVVLTFYYNSNESPAIPEANITRWSLTAYNETVTDRSITKKKMRSHLLVYTMVVQGSVAAQRWGSTFSAPNGQWLFLSEVEIFGSNAVEPPIEPSNPSPSATTPPSVATSTGEMPTPSNTEMSTPSTREMFTPSAMESPTPSVGPADGSATPSFITIIGVLAGVICLLILCVMVVILTLALKMCQARRYSSPESGKGTPGPEAVYSEIPHQSSYGMPSVELNMLPGQSYIEKPPVIDYANNATILKQAISGRVSPVYDEPEKYRIADLSRSMPMIARLTAAQNWNPDRSRCRTESPTVWYRDSDSTESSRSLSSLPPEFVNAISASPSTGQENGYHQLQPSDGEDCEDIAFECLPETEHKYATLEHAALDDDDDTESMSEMSASPVQCEMGVDPPTGVREPPYAKPQRKTPSAYIADGVPPVHTYSPTDRLSLKSPPLGEENLETRGGAEDIEDASVA